MLKSLHQSVYVSSKMANCTFFGAMHTASHSKTKKTLDMSYNSRSSRSVPLLSRHFLWVYKYPCVNTERHTSFVSAHHYEFCIFTFIRSENRLTNSKNVPVTEGPLFSNSESALSNTYRNPASHHDWNISQESKRTMKWVKLNCIWASLESIHLVHSIFMYLISFSSSNF